jgi:hypothetical protein
MFGLMLTGKMDREIKRLGKRPVLQGFWFLYVCLILVVWGEFVSEFVCRYLFVSIASIFIALWSG